MQNFTFYNPTKIVFGKDQLAELDNLVPKGAKVLITYGGGSVKKFGTLNKVKAELEKSSRTLIEFGGIEPNPKYETLMKAVEVVKNEGIDFLLAVGGGSVIDGTKFIAQVVAAKDYVGEEEKILYGNYDKGPVTNLLPIGTVLTLPATGSEMNAGAVVTKGIDKLPVFHEEAYPKFSILDPELTYTLPSRQVANGIIDTFIHVAEQYVTYPAEGRFQDRTAEGILQTLLEIGEKTLKDTKNYDARANLVWCATMGLNGLIGAGVPQDWSTHMIGHEITALFGLDHGVTLAIIQPAIWRVMKEQKKAKLLQYGERVFGIVEGSEDERVEGAIQKTEEFFHKLGVKTKLSENGVKKEDLDKIIISLEKHGRTALSETGKITLDVSKKIVEEAY